MELQQVGQKTYYIKNNTNIGIYKIDDHNVYLIDTGNDDSAGKKILKIIAEQGWNVLGIINTHSHADHIGGNKVIQARTGCSVLAYNVEASFTEYPFLEATCLYGGYPFKDLENKFLKAQPSLTISLKDNLPDGLEYFSLKGHSLDMIGIKTSDNVYFLADALFSEETINKYHLFFLYDVQNFLNTLDYLKTLKGHLYIPSHCEATTDINNLINRNRNKVQEIINKIYELCTDKITFEDILQKVFEHYKLVMNTNQFVLIGSTIKSYLSYLYNTNKVTYIFEDNKMYWFKKETAINN